MRPIPYVHRNHEKLMGIFLSILLTLILWLIHYFTRR
jgi:hypothetical protein